MAEKTEVWTIEELREYQRSGKKPGVAAPAPPPADPLPSKAEVKAEREIHTQIRQELNRRQIEFIHAPMNKKSTLPVGWPDFTIFPPKGRAWLAEIKTLTGTLSKEQKERKAKLEADGFTVYVPRSFEEFKAILLDRMNWQDSTPIKP